MNLINKLLPTLEVPYIKLILKYKVFEDNQSTITLAKVPLMLPRTKYISLKYYHFCQFILNGSVDIKYARIEDEVGDIFTKPLPLASYIFTT